MKRFLMIALAGTFLLAGSSLFAQKIKSGNFTALKGQTVVNLQFDYSVLKVGKKNEADYIIQGKADRNRMKAGSGEAWAESWQNDKNSRFEPTFEKNLSASLSKCGITAKENASEATYTLIVKITFIEPGFQSGVGVSKAAYLNMVVDLVAASDPLTTLGVIDYPKIPSVNMMGYDYDTGTRIQSCFDRAGDNIGKLICKVLK